GALSRLLLVWGTPSRAFRQYRLRSGGQLKSLALVMAGQAAFAAVRDEKTKRAALLRPPRCRACDGRLLGADQPSAAGAPDIDADEQEQPDHVDEVPVPGGKLEAEMLSRAELSGIGPRQAHDQEDGSDQHMEAVEAGRHEEGRDEDIAREIESGVGVFVALHAGEGGAEQDG